MVVSSGLPITLPRAPLPCTRARIPVAFGAVLRMHEDQRLHFLGFGPEGIEFWRREFFAFDMSANGRAAQALVLNAFFQLLGREFGKLQRHGGKAHKAIRILRVDHCGKLFDFADR